MWQRFTESARRSVFFAQEEAGRLGENYVSTEHLLLGLMRDTENEAVIVLEHMGISRGRVRSEVERQVSRGDGRLAQDMQLTPRGKRVIDLAYDEMQQLNDRDIDTEHLLLGLLREGEGLAGRVLSKLGANLENAREAVVACRQGGGGARRRLPSIGDLGILRADEGRNSVELAFELQTFWEMAALLKAKDSFGYREMQEQERFLVVPAGVKIKRLQSPVDPQKGKLGSEWALYVRIRDGEFAGRAGWIAATAFECTDEEDEPFPPPLPGRTENIG